MTDKPVDEQLDSLLAELVAQQLAGKTPDVNAVAEAHPEFRDRLHQRWEEVSHLWRQLGDVQAAKAPGLPPGTKLADYEIQDELGRGGMGVVYAAEQLNPRRRVALKIMSGPASVNADTVRLFEREIQALARLKHPSIATVHNAGCTPDGEHFFAMELVEGSELDRYVDATQPARRELLGLFCTICEAVDYAHKHGVIHRDLKPGNILVDESGVPKILDFGLARITDKDIKATTIDRSATRIQGTLPYMSPEQARGDPAEIDIRTDVYSLGVILYQLLTGELPFSLTDVPLHSAVRIICESEPQRPSVHDRSIRGDLETIILKALAKEAHRRYQSAGELAADVQRFLAYQPILARRASITTRILKSVRRRPGIAVSTVLVAIVSGLGFSLLNDLAAKRAADRREQIAALRDQASNQIHAATLGQRPTWSESLMSKRIAAAQDSLDTLISLDPQSSWAFMQRGRLRLDAQKDPQQALVDFDRAKQLGSLPVSAEASPASRTRDSTNPRRTRRPALIVHTSQIRMICISTPSRLDLLAQERRHLISIRR